MEGTTPAANLAATGKHKRDEEKQIAKTALRGMHRVWLLTAFF